MDVQEQDDKLQPPWVRNRELGSEWSNAIARARPGRDLPTAARLWRLVRKGGQTHVFHDGVGFNGHHSIVDQWRQRVAVNAEETPLIDLLATRVDSAS